MSHTKSKRQNSVNLGGYGFDRTNTSFIASDNTGHTYDFYSSDGTASNDTQNIYLFSRPETITIVNRCVFKDYPIRRYKEVSLEEPYSLPLHPSYCPINEPDVIYDHTIAEHSPRHVIIEDENEYDRYIGNSSRRRGSANSQNSRPRHQSRHSFSRSIGLQYYDGSGDQEAPNSRSSSLQGLYASGNEEDPPNSRSSSLQCHFASGGEEEVPNHPPNRCRVNFSDDHEGASSISEDYKNGVDQRNDRLIGLFRGLLRKYE